MKDIDFFFREAPESVEADEHSKMETRVRWSLLDYSPEENADFLYNYDLDVKSNNVLKYIRLQQKYGYSNEHFASLYSSYATGLKSLDIDTVTVIQ